MINTKIDGLKELDDLLKDLPDRVARRQLVGALRAGAGSLQKEVIANAPDSPKIHKFGDLRENIKVRFIRATQRNAVAVAVTTGRAFYAHWVEFGREAVRVVKKKVLSDGKQFFGTEVAAQPPRPFMRPAFDTKGRQIIDTIVKRLKAGIEREYKRRGR
jgi:HK97 gp10 family phage protein